MNASSLIFVALIAAWGVYLVPKIRDERPSVGSARVSEALSRTVRVLARRDAVDGAPRLVTQPADYSPAPTPTATRPTPTVQRSELRRQAARKAAQRRRRVLGALVLLLLAVGGAVEWQALPVWALAAPVVLIAAWLVACRCMVRKERPVSILRPVPVNAEDTVSITTQVELALEEDGAPAEDPTQSWTPVSAPLPTYVDAPVAERTVRTIDLDGTGVWSAGHNESDSALAREAELVRRRIMERQQDRKTS